MKLVSDAFSVPKISFKESKMHRDVKRVNEHSYSLNFCNVSCCFRSIQSIEFYHFNLVKKSRKIDTKYFAIEVDMEQKYHTNQIFSNKSQKAVALSCNDKPIVQ